MIIKSIHKNIRLFKYHLFNVYIHKVVQHLTGRGSFVHTRITVGVFSLLYYYLRKRVCVKFEINIGW